MLSQNIVFTSKGGHAGFINKYSTICGLNPLFKIAQEFIQLIRGLADLRWVLHYSAIYVLPSHDDQNFKNFIRQRACCLTGSGMRFFSQTKASFG